MTALNAERIRFVADHSDRFSILAKFSSKGLHLLPPSTGLYEGRCL
jgi:hypothetical protein